MDNEVTHVVEIAFQCAAPGWFVLGDLALVDLTSGVVLVRFATHSVFARSWIRCAAGCVRNSMYVYC
jgi:hypothetical protein